MKTILSILKRIAQVIGIILVLIIIAGLTYRLVGSEQHEPLGKMVDVGGFKLHIHSEGVQNNKPTLVIESGMGLPTEHYHWLSEVLKDSIRVVRYDRAGIGYSDLSDTSRDPETVARELHTLLKKAGESPPYILAGHSFGGPFIKVFTELYPDEVMGLVFIDATHPERVERLGLPTETSSKFKWYIRSLHAQGYLGDLGVLGLYDRINGPLLAGEGLPENINTRMLDFSMNGKYVRGFIKEMKHYFSGLKRSGQVSDFGALPIVVFATDNHNPEFLIKRGINPEERLTKTLQMYQDFADLSSNSKLIFIKGNHNSIYTKKENAMIICNEVTRLLKVSKDEIVMP
ncbi:alpha/beta hydrolase [Spongiivirga sp. MCCC 1A20706]|uniref:alpha/beta fold hydrolase n=1 Tax=Spongiivirga sp. MCCC 1A20706 TaxID=3160963 RepID=UPI003977C38B